MSFVGRLEPPIVPEGLGSMRVAERSRLVDEVTHRLRELILTHKIPAGSKLVQMDLASRMGVSRTPLREAIRLLEQDGLVRVSNGNRTVEVVQLTAREMAELYEIREVIDGLAARLVARRGLSAAADAKLSTHLETMARSVLPEEGEAFLVAHIGFHAAILQDSPNVRLLSELQLVRITAASLRDEFPRRLRAARDRGDPMATDVAAVALAQHEAIADAIRSRDEDLAERVARTHIREAFDLIPPDVERVADGGSG
jgi:GntR family transcriptional regulator of vanillate catabolism